MPRRKKGKSQDAILNLAERTPESLAEAMNEALHRLYEEQNWNCIDRHTEMLPVKLNELEVRDRGKQLAATFGELLTEEARQAKVKKEMKATLVKIEERQTALSDAIATGEENRQVPVKVVLLPGDEFVSEIREDTGEPVRTRIASEFERQGRLITEQDLGFSPADGGDGASPEE
jgi:hypothetical protein